jgi:hypothetical protein
VDAAQFFRFLPATSTHRYALTLNPFLACALFAGPLLTALRPGKSHVARQSSWVPLVPFSQEPRNTGTTNGLHAHVWRLCGAQVSLLSASLSEKRPQPQGVRLGPPFLMLRVGGRPPRAQSKVHSPPRCSKSLFHTIRNSLPSRTLRSVPTYRGFSNRMLLRAVWVRQRQSPKPLHRRGLPRF